ncbi:MAG: hypothetical protein P9L94_17780 [Candidatus Hinthialibacter antarcticus]|nr:hypothetical protein [Candidatus Hinthialibacter antarcticus]
MKILNCIVYFSLVLLMNGCVTNQVPRLTTDQIIWNPRTEFGESFKQKHLNEFYYIIRKTEDSPETASLNFVEDGISVVSNENSVEEYQIMLHLYHGVVYNTLKTTYQSRAASSYARNLFSLSKNIAFNPGLLDDQNINGCLIILEWKATNFLDDPYKLRSSQEGITAFIPKQALRDYANMKISIQELERQSVFTSSLGRMELDFSDTI